MKRSLILPLSGPCFFSLMLVGEVFIALPSLHLNDYELSRANQLS